MLDYRSAAAHAGGMGFITAASFPEDDTLIAEINKARALCGDLPFGVNISILPKLVPGDRTENIFRLIADQGVKVVETSGRNPAPYMALLKKLDLTVIHKVPAVRFALKAQAVGADMVTIVGAECGGHPGMDMMGSFVNAAMASERDTAFVMHTVHNTVRALANKTTQIVAKMEADNPNGTIEDLMPLVSGKIGRRAYETGDVSKGLLSAGHALGLTKAIVPMAEIFAQLEAQAHVALEQLQLVRSV